MNSLRFDPGALYDRHRTSCYVLLYDLFSFPTFFKDTNEPETMRPLMTDYYSTIRRSIHRHGGMLEKIMADIMLAILGLYHTQPRQIA